MGCGPGNTFLKTNLNYSLCLGNLGKNQVRLFKTKKSEHMLKDEWYECTSVL